MAEQFMTGLYVVVFAVTLAAIVLSVKVVINIKRGRLRLRGDSFPNATLTPGKPREKDEPYKLQITFDKQAEDMFERMAKQTGYSRAGLIQAAIGNMATILVRGGWFYHQREAGTPLEPVHFYAGRAEVDEDGNPPEPLQGRHLRLVVSTEHEEDPKES